MNSRLRLGLLLPVVLILRVATAQTKPVSARSAIFAPLPESAFQPVVTSVMPSNAAGVRYQYQQVRLYNNECVYLAPAWRGKTKLEPTKRGLFVAPDLGELDGMLLQTLNEMAAEGWELVEVQNLVKPIKVEQEDETSYAHNDAQRPVHTRTTEFETVTQTRYLLRKPLADK